MLHPYVHARRLIYACMAFWKPRNPRTGNVAFYPRAFCDGILM